MAKSIEMEELILDLGCGNKKREGTIGVDFNTRLDGDVNHDLNQFPYPFESETVDKIYIDNCLEHLDEPLKVMEEIHRILKFDGEVEVIVPYFRSPGAFIDPTHTHFFTVNSFAYFDPKTEIYKRYGYTESKFSVLKIIFHENLVNGALKKLFVNFANKHTELYERYLSHLIPLDEISFYLKKIK